MGEGDEGQTGSGSRAKNPGLLLFNLISDAVLHCFSETRRPCLGEQRGNHWDTARLVRGAHHHPFPPFPSRSLCGPRSATLDMSRAIRMKDWAAPPWSLLGVAAAESAQAHLQEAETAARENKMGFNKARVGHDASENGHSTPSRSAIATATEGSGSWRQGLSQRHDRLQL